jgi:hypothetical protein
MKGIAVRLSLSKAWEESRRIFLSDGGLLIAVALGLLVLPQIIAGVVAPPTQAETTGIGRIATLAAALIGVIGQLAVVRLALGPSTSVGQAIAHGGRRFPHVIGAFVILLLGFALLLIPLLAVLMAMGLVQVPVAGQQPTPSFSLVMLLLLVAGLLLAVRFMMAVPVGSAETLGPIGIIKRSWRLSAGRFWPLFGLEVLLLTTALILLGAAQLVGGTLAGLIGRPEPFSLAALLFAIVVATAQAAFTVLASVMLARVYTQLAASADARPSVPTTGT